MKRWGGLDPQAKKYTVLIMALLILLAIVPAANPDEEIVYKTKTVTEVVKETKVVKKIDFPDVCLRHAEAAVALADLATEYAASPDKALDYISAARIAVADKDNAASVKVAQDLLLLIDQTDDVANQIVGASVSEENLLGQCKAALK